jgi:hypothetical protein
MISRGDRLDGTMWRDVRRHDEHAGEPERVTRRDRRGDMAAVDGVESAAENPDAIQ